MHVKRLLAVFTLVLILLSFVGCADNKISTSIKETQLKSPPTLEVLYKDKSIEAVRGTYSWTIDNNDGTKSTTMGDSAPPNELVKNTIPLVVVPKSDMTLNFSYKQNNIKVNIWQDHSRVEQVVADNKIIAPMIKGSVVYEVIATWEQGTVCYAFLVNVN